MSVIWSFRAVRHLEHAMSRTATAGETRTLAERRSEIDGILRHCFGRFDSLIVQDLFTGFRPRIGEAILLIELTVKGEISGLVVKLGPPERLLKEHTGWESCRPVNMGHDLVLVSMRGCHQRKWMRRKGPLMALAYNDAQRQIATAQTPFLQDAFLDAVRYGRPTVASLAGVFNQLFDRLGALLYTRSHIDDPAEKNFTIRIGHLTTSLDLWSGEGTDTQAASIRRDVNSFARLDAGWFRDPVDYLRYVNDEIANPTQRAFLIPRMLRGCAHGDLNGRNVLVGRAGNRGERAEWPAVYDYEHMSPENLLGWDFAKLETELKIRAYHEIFGSRGNALFIEAIQKCEHDLAVLTEQCHNTSIWPDASAAQSETPEKRLQLLLLTIRHQAQTHLGRDRGRPREWLDELYFLLGCYGLVTVRFGNLDHLERVGAYISAGVAFARLLWNREPSLVPLPGSSPTNGTGPKDLLAGRWPSYIGPFTVAQSWIQAGHHQAAIELLQGLRGRYPHAQAIASELILALQKAGLNDQADALSERVEAEFPGATDEETLQRLAKQHKSEGDNALKEAGDTPESKKAAYRIADLCYQRSLEFSEKAYNLRHNHYPGINRATLMLIRAGLARELGLAVQEKELLESCREAARLLLREHSTWEPRRPDDNIWLEATLAEVYLLLQEWESAKAHYIHAGTRPNAQPFHHKAITDQIERIVPAFARLGIRVPSPFDNPKSMF